MKKNLSSRDLKKLSAYLDGELNASASREMKSRLERLRSKRSGGRDLNLLAALEALRDTRAVLRRTPHRRAPRNFTLSPQMVAKRPPMPRLVPALNYASVLAMLLFFFSFLPPIGFGGEAMAPVAAPEMMMEAPVAEEAPAEEEFAAAEEPARAEESMPMADAPAVEEGEAVEVSPTAEFSLTPRVEIEAEKTVADQEADAVLAPALPSSGTLVAEITATPRVNEVPEFSPSPIFSSWQQILLAVIIFFPLIGFVLRRMVIMKWQKKTNE